MDEDGGDQRAQARFGSSAPKRWMREEGNGRWHGTLSTQSPPQLERTRSSPPFGWRFWIQLHADQPTIEMIWRCVKIGREVGPGRKLAQVREYVWREAENRVQPRGLEVGTWVPILISTTTQTPPTEEETDSFVKT